MIAVSQSTHRGMTWIHSSLLHPCMLDYFYTCLCYHARVHNKDRGRVSYSIIAPKTGLMQGHYLLLSVVMCEM